MITLATLGDFKRVYQNQKMPENKEQFLERLYEFWITGQNNKEQEITRSILTSFNLTKIY